MVKIPLKDILYIQADRNYCSVHTTEKEFLVVMPLKEFYQKLSSGHFLRIHRSFVVNLSHIQEIGTGHVVIERKSLPLSKSSKEELLKHLQTL
ncbi:MAG: LytTR family DNA-binding domain-containing protein [Marinilabilia sp.]